MKPADLTGSLVSKIPFHGFYETKWSDLIDWQESDWTEYRTSEDDDSGDSERRYPEPMRLNAGELAEILFRVTDYSAAYRAIAELYAEGFNSEAGEALDLELGLTFESMDSPREYNFATDRIYCHMPEATARALFARSAAEGHQHLREIVAARFTSRSGFASYYDADADGPEWLARDVAEWDHNQLETLLVAALAGSDGASLDEIEWAIYESIPDSGYSEWSGAVDWEKFEERRDEARAEKLADWREDDPEAAAAYEGTPDYLRAVRCPLTPDLFAPQRH